MDAVHCMCCILARMIKQLLPTGLWEVDDRLSKAKQVGGSDRKNQNVRCVDGLSAFREVLQKKEELRLTRWSPSTAGKDAVLLTVMLSAWDLKHLVIESPINQKPTGGGKANHLWRLNASNLEKWLGISLLRRRWDYASQPRGGGHNLNVVHLDLSTLFQMVSRQLLVIVREGHRPVQRLVNKRLQA